MKGEKDTIWTISIYSHKTDTVLIVSIWTRWRVMTSTMENSIQEHRDTIVGSPDHDTDETTSPFRECGVTTVSICLIWVYLRRRRRSVECLENSFSVRKIRTNTGIEKNPDLS